MNTDGKVRRKLNYERHKSQLTGKKLFGYLDQTIDRRNVYHHKREIIEPIPLESFSSPLASPITRHHKANQRKLSV